MSLWFRRRTGKRTDYYSVSVPIMVLLSLFGILVALVLALLRTVLSQ